MAGACGVTKPTSVPTRPGPGSVHHHGSHRQLLKALPVVHFPSDVDAVIVPTARHPAVLDSAIALATKLNCTLVALCSKFSSAAEVAVFRAAAGIRVIAVDIGEMPAGVIPTFGTCRVLAGTKFERRSDTSLKRNFGLLLARILGWQRIVFLDDDIHVPEPMDLREAAGMTGRYAGVGLAIDDVNGMADNSVVCHAYREAGGVQDVFIGGGALAVNPMSVTSFFPNIYNEDWFFLLDEGGLLPVTTVGTAIQNNYDPFLESRARREELGDCIAEGLFWLLDSGRSLRDANAGHWQRFLRERVAFITDVIHMVERMGGDVERRHRMLLALRAARGRCQYIRPELCVRYLDAWRADRVRWRKHLDDAHRTFVVKRKKGRAERRSLAGVRDTFRSLGFSDRAVRLHLPAQQPLDHDLADLEVSYAVPVGH